MLALAVGAAVAVRCHKLDAPAISADEAFSWRLATSPISEMLAAAALDTHPPLHFILESMWIKCFGGSLFALRSLSVLAAAATVPITFGLVRETRRPASPGAPCTDIGAMLSATLVALHPFQVAQTRVARMYACGILFAALSSWLLLRAARSHRATNFSRAWGAYGVVMALFCLCHHFAVFTVAAHALFVAVECLRIARVRSWREGRDLGEGFAGACALALEIYSPWIAATLAQGRRVGTEFWVPPLTSRETLAVMVSWAFGECALSLSFASLWPWTAVGATAFVVAALVLGRVGRFFLLLAFVPWAAAILITTVGGRPLLQERYLAFAHVGFLCLLGAAVERIPWFAARIASAAVLVAVSAMATPQVLANVGQRDALSQGGRYILDGYRAGDVVVVARPHSLLRLRYYCAMSGHEEINMKVPLDVAPNGGQINHVAALRGDEVIASEDQSELAGSLRVWKLRRGLSADALARSWRLVRTRRFRETGDQSGTGYSVELWARDGAP